jgi:hypothetical protein
MVSGSLNCACVVYGRRLHGCRIANALTASAASTRRASRAASIARLRVAAHLRRHHHEVDVVRVVGAL